MFKGILKKQRREGPARKITISHHPTRVEHAIPRITAMEKHLQDLVGTTVGKQAEEKLINSKGKCPAGTIHDLYCSGETRRPSRFQCKSIKETPVKCYDITGESFVYPTTPVKRIETEPKISKEAKVYTRMYEEALQTYFNVYPDEAMIFEIRYETIHDLAKFMYQYFSEISKKNNTGMPRGAPFELGSYLVDLTRQVVAQENDRIQKQQAAARQAMQRKQAIQRAQRAQRAQKPQRSQASDMQESLKVKLRPRAQASNPERLDDDYHPGLTSESWGQIPQTRDYHPGLTSASWGQIPQTRDYHPGLTSAASGKLKQQPDQWVEVQKPDKIAVRQKGLKTSSSGKQCLDKCIKKLNPITRQVTCGCKVSPYRNYGVMYDWDYCNLQDCP